MQHEQQRRICLSKPRANPPLTKKKGIIDATGNERFAYDTYRRFLNMYSDVVMNLEKEPFEEVRYGTVSAKLSRVPCVPCTRMW